MKKHCTHCGRDRTLQDFHLDRANRDGLSSRCRDCERQYGHARRQHLAMMERLRNRRLQDDPLVEEDASQWIARRRREERYDEAMEES